MTVVEIPLPVASTPRSGVTPGSGEFSIPHDPAYFTFAPLGMTCVPLAVQSSTSEPSMPISFTLKLATFVNPLAGISILSQISGYI